MDEHRLFLGYITALVSFVVFTLLFVATLGCAKGRAVPMGIEVSDGGSEDNDGGQNADTTEEISASQSNDETPRLLLTWQTSDGELADRIALTGEIRGNGETSGEWTTFVTAENDKDVAYEVPFADCSELEFSVAFVQNNRNEWSCTVCPEPLHGVVSAVREDETLAPVIVDNGLGGCNLLVVAPPCEAESDFDPVAAFQALGTDGEMPEESEDTADDPGAIVCLEETGVLILNFAGPFDADSFIEGGLSPIVFIAVASDETGWNPVTVMNSYSSNYLGPWLPHSIAVPGTVDRFNLYISNGSDYRWFDLNETDWVVTGAGCEIQPDGFGGHVITR